MACIHSQEKRAHRSLTTRSEASFDSAAASQTEPGAGCAAARARALCSAADSLDVREATCKGAPHGCQRVMPTRHLI